MIESPKLSDLVKLWLKDLKSEYQLTTSWVSPNIWRVVGGPSNSIWAWVHDTAPFVYLPPTDVGAHGETIKATDPEFFDKLARRLGIENAHSQSSRSNNALV